MKEEDVKHKEEFLGVFGSVGNTTVAGTIADMFPKENRSLPMGVFVVCVL
jgi:hypothetical protein